MSNDAVLNTWVLCVLWAFYVRNVSQLGTGSKKLTLIKTGKNKGKIKVKKGTKKGTYKLKVKVTAAGSATYKSGSKTVTLKVMVK